MTVTDRTTDVHATPDQDATTALPFDLDHFLALPRLSGLHLSPDGTRLVVSVATPAADGKRMASTIWAVDPAGKVPSARLTRSTKGESASAFTPDGSLLFTSARPDPDAKPDEAADDQPLALWLLPSGGGEARVVSSPRAGVENVRVARDAGTTLLTTQLFPGAGDLAVDAEREKARKDAGVSALLFEEYPIRFWDHYVGPRSRHLVVADPPTHVEGRLENERDVTRDATHALIDAFADISPDGRSVVVAWREQSQGLSRETSNLVVIDAATGDRHHLTTGENFYEHPVFSPDGRWVVAIRNGLATPDRLPPTRLHLVELATGAVRELAADLDRWPHDPVWTADSSAVLFLADDDGRTVPWRVELADGSVTRLVSAGSDASEGSYSALCPAPDGSTLFALRSTLDRPPHVVRLSATSAVEHVEVPSPATPEESLPRRGRVERVETRAADGQRIASWLVLPEAASAEHPVPLVVFVHGGPIGSWAGWHWRWNPHLLAERGYAVLMPDPAISTGYGLGFMQRGWGRWGKEPFTDVMDAADAVLERPDIDRERTALMGGSFGGYMANWVAGQTERFRCIVTHASLWGLRGFHGTTDHGPWMEQELGDPYVDDSLYRENDPAGRIADIRTPMLVIHGELDHRVPISEALTLWTDLRRHGVPSRFLYFPDENHWILKPQNARIWYETVLAFLDEHVLGKPFARPALL